MLNKANATTALCKTSKTSSPYCKYIGKISKVYVNSDGLVLIFLDKNIPIEMAKKYNYEINSGQAIAFEITPENSYLTSKIHNMVMSAITHNMEVEIHSRKTIKGYMKLDRIWLEKSTGLFR
jgi:hypothetical protein